LAAKSAKIEEEARAYLEEYDSLQSESGNNLAEISRLKAIIYDLGGDPNKEESEEGESGNDRDFSEEENDNDSQSDNNDKKGELTDSDGEKETKSVASDDDQEEETDYLENDAVETESVVQSNNSAEEDNQEETIEEKEEEFNEDELNEGEKEILKQIRDLEKAIKKIEDRVENGQKISDPQFYVQMEESKKKWFTS